MKTTFTADEIMTFIEELMSELEQNLDALQLHNEALEPFKKDIPENPMEALRALQKGCIALGHAEAKSQSLKQIVQFFGVEITTPKIPSYSSN